jgi:hypothetical protein
MLLIGVASMPQSASAQCDLTPPPQQTALPRPIQLGISGGNIHSTTKIGRAKGCFSGTLGSMVQDTDSNQYILSNNHVLADQNKAKPGQLIVQPGLVDVECLKSTSDAVATFSRAVKLKFGGSTNTVDAAIAAVEPGDVSPEILNIGETASSPATPTIGLPVQKMGRTSCYTTGVIAALNANVTVNYSDTKKPKLGKFVNQILVTGSPLTPVFGIPGDSGSLILNQDLCPEPVALLFAGSSTGTLAIANPISEVLSALDVTMVGSCTPLAAPAGADADALAANVGSSNEAVASATAIRNRHEAELMRIAGAVGTGIAAGGEPGQLAIEVYVGKLTPKAQARAPKEVEGLPVKLVQTGELKAF